MKSPKPKSKAMEMLEKTKLEQEIIKSAAFAAGSSPTKEILVSIEGIVFPLASFRSMCLLRAYHQDGMQQAIIHLTDRSILCDEDHYNQVLEILKDHYTLLEPRRKELLS